jgi:hypothetical protein
MTAHCVANNFGATAAAACAAKLNAQQMRWVLDYAAQQASGLNASRVQHITPIRQGPELSTLNSPVCHLPKATTEEQKLHEEYS